jgi:anti-sigma B factor antagonist
MSWLRNVEMNEEFAFPLEMVKAVPARDLDDMIGSNHRMASTDGTGLFGGHPREHELSLAGELDLAACPKLVDELVVAIAQGTGDLVVDCSEVTFFDAAAVSALLEAREELDASGRRLLVRSPSRAVRRVLDILALGSLFAEVGNGNLQVASAGTALAPNEYGQLSQGHRRGLERTLVATPGDPSRLAALTVGA